MRNANEQERRPARTPECSVQCCSFTFGPIRCQDGTPKKFRAQCGQDVSNVCSSLLIAYVLPYSFSFVFYLYLLILTFCYKVGKWHGRNFNIRIQRKKTFVRINKFISRHTCKEERCLGWNRPTACLRDIARQGEGGRNGFTVVIVQAWTAKSVMKESKSWFRRNI
jgi:hypothetical protein